MDLIRFSIYVVLVSIIITVGGFILAYYDSKTGFGESLRIENMKRDYRDRFSYELQHQSGAEIYVIMPERYGGEKIDELASELGLKFGYNLDAVEFRYKHVIYKYIKTKGVKE